MRQITLSRNSLRTLTQQLEAHGNGYNIKQIRTLDKVVAKFNPLITDYNKKIDDMLLAAQTEAAAEPERTAEINKTLNDEVNALVAAEGSEQLKVVVEDAEYDFIKVIWDNTEGFKGAMDQRKVILEIDDALQNTTNPDTNN